MSKPYDLNFCFPLQELSSDKVKLTPFIPPTHGDMFFEASKSYPEIYTWVPFGPFSTKDNFLQWVETRVRIDPAVTLFAVLDKTSPDGEEKIAGLIGLLNTSPENLSTEIGFVLTLPPFQRTHVTTHAVGILLFWCLDELGMRRVQWQANEDNEKSWMAAEKLGFTKEMVKRWERALPLPKVSIPARSDARNEWGGRHTVVLAICWDNWGTVKENLKSRMDRH